MNVLSPRRCPCRSCQEDAARRAAGRPRYNFFYYAYAVLAAISAAGLGLSIRYDDGLAVFVGTLMTTGIVWSQNRARIESSRPGRS